MGEDNYKFANSATSFGYPSNYRIPLERYTQLFSPVTAQYYYNAYGAWGGSCFGFSASADLMNDGELSPSKYQSGANSVYSLSTPGAANNSVTLLLELYQISQLLPEMQSAMNTSKNDYTKFVNEMISSDGSGMVIGYVTPGWGGHAIVGYGIAKVSENIYDISVYDSNYPTDNNRKMRVDTANRTFSYSDFGG
jgi:hypothetical protein